MSQTNDTKTHDTTRRDFLKTGSAAGLSLAGGLSLARSAHAQGSDELTFVLIGCGGRGTGAAVNNLSSCKGTKLIAVADAFEDRAKGSLGQIKRRHEDQVDVPDDRVFSGFDAYKKAIACDPDIVMLATPPGFRPIHYKAAIEAGKHVFMEKPCCVDAPGFRTLMEANKKADDSGRKVVVGLQRRHQQGYIDNVKRIQDGAIGDFVFSRVFWNSGGVWTRERQPDQTEMEYQMRNWYYFNWLCGDHICEQHVHNIDVSNWVKDAHPVEANGMGGRQVRTGNEHGQIYDHHFIEFTYPDGTKMYSQCRHIRNCWNQVSETIVGTEGQMGPGGGGPNPYNQEHIDLIAAIRQDEARNEGWYGATSSFTAVLGRMATYSGKVIKWDEAVEKGPDIMPEQFAFDATPPVVPDEDGNYPVAMPGMYDPFKASF